MADNPRIKTSEGGWVISLKCAKQPVQLPSLKRCVGGGYDTRVFDTAAAAGLALSKHAFRAKFEVRRVTVTFYEQTEEPTDAG